jgi:peptidoglycan/LPS O-acetylase OafA/YrhL
MTAAVGQPEAAQSPSMPTPPRRWSSGYIPGLDGLRAFAVLAVMFYHFLYLAPRCTGWCARVQDISSWGWCGVDLFFVLSGFLITGILLDAKAKAAAHYFSSFYMRRALRIFPLYYGVVLLVALGMHSAAASRFFGFDEIHGSLGWMFAYLGNFYLAFHNKNDFGPIGHFWSLAVEEHFYLLWPALVWLCSRRQFAMTCGAFIVGAVALRTGLILALGTRGTEATYLITPCRVDGLAMGGLLALLVRTDVHVERVRRWAWTFGGVALLALVAVSFRRGGFNHYGRTMNLAGFTFLAICFASIVALLISARPNSPARRLLEHPALISIGRYSFAMYVLHFIFMRPFLYYFAPAAMGRWLHSLNAGIFVYAMASAVTTYLLAFASWRLFEKHFLRLKRLFPYT